MKKRNIILGSVVGVLLIASVAVIAASGSSVFGDFFAKNHSIQQDKSIAAVVNGEKIYQSSIDSELAFAKLSTSLSAAQVNQLNIPAEQKQSLLEKQKNAQKSADQILDDLIRETVILQEAKRRGITVTKEEAQTFAEEQYATVKALALASEATSAEKDNYAFIQAYMKEEKLSEEQYIRRVAGLYQKLLIAQKMQTALLSEKSADDVQRYIDELVSKATITRHP